MSERYLFLSDTHSNYPALRAVFEEAERFGPFAGILCTGDVVGYGAFPNECVEAMRGRNVIVTRGNHDRAIASGDAEDFNPLALWAVEHNQRVLTPENMDYLRDLKNTPYVDPQGRFAMVHGSFAGVEAPKNPLEERFEDIYILYPEDAVEAMAAMRFNDKIHTFLGNVGHTHQPMAAITDIEYSGIECIPHDLRMHQFESHEYTNGGIVLESNMHNVKDEKFPKFLFNFGSVGQPRHGSPNACYGIVEFDDDVTRVIFRHVEYDVEEAQRKMEEEGFPDPLIIRLELGR